MGRVKQTEIQSVRASEELSNLGGIIKVLSDVQVDGYSVEDVVEG